MIKLTNRDRDWNQIHAALLRRVGNMPDAFVRLRWAWPELARFGAASELLTALESPTDDAVEQDRIFRALLASMRKREESYAPLARDLLWLMAWPTLTDLYRRVRPAEADGAQTAADVSMAFAEVIIGIALTLDRPVREALTDGTAEELDRMRLDDRRWKRRHKLGEPLLDSAARGLTVDLQRDMSALRDQAVAKMGESGALHFDRTVCGYTVPELAKQWGVSERTIRRRLQQGKLHAIELSRR